MTNQSPAEAEELAILRQRINDVLNNFKRGKIEQGLTISLIIEKMHFYQHHQALLQKIEKAISKKPNAARIEQLAGDSPSHRAAYIYGRQDVLDEFTNILNQAREGKL